MKRLHSKESDFCKFKSIQPRIQGNRLLAIFSPATEQFLDDDGNVQLIDSTRINVKTLAKRSENLLLHGIEPNETNRAIEAWASYDR